MADSRSGAGGKIIANRRKQRLSTTPYDPPPSQPSPDKSLSWFSGTVLPSARAIASGAGKILVSVLYSDSSSSEEDEEKESGADGNDNDEDTYDGVNALHERIETKLKIEQLIMQESFSREECDKLTELLKSRVVDWSVEAGKRFATPPGKMTHNVGDIHNEAVLEAKKWFQEKKMGPSSVENTDEGMCDLNAPGTEHVIVSGAVGSPLDLARSYMRDRTPWASPTKQIELSAPLTARMELIKEGTSYPVVHDSLSTSKKWNSVASGSWNIQEELRRVRAKATEDMLRSPSSRIDPSLFAVVTRQEGMGKKAIDPDSFRENLKIGVLMDAGVCSDPALAVLESRQDGKASKALSSKPANLSSGNNEDSEVGQIDGVSFMLKPQSPTSFKSEELHTGLHGPPENEVTKIGRTPGVNGFSLSETSLTEACVEIPIVTETASIASGSQNSLSIMQHEELSEEMIQRSTGGNTDLMHGKQLTKKSGGNLRRSKRRGK